ncbi:MAG TPA: hypothetical protein VLC52_14990 [Anaerolineae bacterium]|nr:hypothetical protein [Anaerolineae bacterium]
MEVQSTHSNNRQEAWAEPVDRLKVHDLPQEALNLNVEGRRPGGLLKGFGQLWQKTYQIALPGLTVTPGEVVQIWKDRFSSFWPEGARFYRSGPAGQAMQPGDVAVLNLDGPGGALISTGIMVMYADDEAFSFMTPEGHMFAGMITFSAYEENGVTMAQAQAFIRGNDPLVEVLLRLGLGHKSEDVFWQGTLRNLATHLGIEAEPAEPRYVLVDRSVQWAEARNIWQSAGIRTILHTPVRWIRRLRLA